MSKKELKRFFLPQKKEKKSLSLCGLKKKCYFCGSSQKVTKKKHLKQERRCVIFLMRKEKKTMESIAEILNVYKSIISREIKRNSINGKYSYLQAEEQAKIRKERLKEPRKMSKQVINRIEQLSPEQIVGSSKKKRLYDGVEIKYL